MLGKEREKGNVGRGAKNVFSMFFAILRAWWGVRASGANAENKSQGIMYL